MIRRGAGACVAAALAIALSGAAQKSAPHGVPRTPDGHLDLQRVRNNSTLTPPTRP